MMRLMVVFGHMRLGRIVTAQSNATGLAGAQVHPVPAMLDAFFTDISFWQFQVLHLQDMGAAWVSIHVCVYLNFRKIFMDKADGHRSFPDSRGNPVHGSCP